jgi:hypothetical protein
VTVTITCGQSAMSLSLGQLLLVALAFAVTSSLLDALLQKVVR